MVCFTPCFIRKLAAIGVHNAKKMFSIIKNNMTLVNENPTSKYRYSGINNSTIELANDKNPIKK